MTSSDDAAMAAEEETTRLGAALLRREAFARDWAEALSHGRDAAVARDCRESVEREIHEDHPEMFAALAWRWPLEDARRIHPPWQRRAECSWCQWLAGVDSWVPTDLPTHLQDCPLCGQASCEQASSTGT